MRAKGGAEEERSDRVISTPLNIESPVILFFFFFLLRFLEFISNRTSIEYHFSFCVTVLFYSISFVVPGMYLLVVFFLRISSQPDRSQLKQSRRSAKEELEQLRQQVLTF